MSFQIGNVIEMNDGSVIVVHNIVTDYVTQVTSVLGICYKGAATTYVSFPTNLNFKKKWTGLLEYRGDN